MSKQGAQQKWGSVPTPTGEWPAEDGLGPTLTTRKARLLGQADRAGPQDDDENVVSFPAGDTINVTAQADVVFPHPLVHPTAGGLTDARAWCKWCGNRIIATPEGGFVPAQDGPMTEWVHHSSVGEEDVEGIFNVPDCPGPEPSPR